MAEPAMTAGTITTMKVSVSTFVDVLHITVVGITIIRIVVVVFIFIKMSLIVSFQRESLLN